MIVSVKAEGQDDMRVIDHPVKFSRSRKSSTRGPQKLGAQTKSVLAELGFDDAQIAKASNDSQ
jgi:crotonobetainyl-CoA:carnitine CoA-transferase CaiB-like acyl-CoA transferase